MPDLIDRHALLTKIYDNPPEKERMTHAEWYRKCIYEAPKVEAEPVLHGYWEPSEDGGYYCTHCGVECDTDEFHKVLLNHFCGNCGAEMW